jgi:tetratricopeptide (TPR) repeat protein
VPLPDDLDPRDLEQESRRQLTSLSKETAELVAKHLIMAGRLIDDDPEQALVHARAARGLGGRVAVVREANGLVAYAAGEWAEALTELRTARRISGEPDHLPVMADCERALGRPDRALEIGNDPQVAKLPPAARVEMMIVVSGARRDLGQPEAAAVALDVPALEGPVREWTARLRYAYADALLECGREDDARDWFARAAEVDEHGETDAEDRVLELDGIVFDELEGDLEDLPQAPPAPEEPLVDMSAQEVPEGASSQVSGGAAPLDSEIPTLAVAAPAFTTAVQPEPERVRQADAAPVVFSAPDGSSDDDAGDDELTLFD